MRACAQQLAADLGRVVGAAVVDQHDLRPPAGRSADSASTSADGRGAAIDRDDDRKAAGEDHHALRDGGVVLYFDSGVSVASGSSDQPALVSPAWLSIRPGYPVQVLSTR